jgi:homoserine O-acetyltransferase/O-succinyltransferase
MKRISVFVVFLLVAAAAFAQPPQAPRNYPEPKPGDFTARQFKFKTGEQMDVRMHYYTVGTPAKDASGKVTNAVLILHGTGGSGRSLLGPTFAGALFCPGCLLDGTKYFIVSPDNVGHGSSSKPSDGMKMLFPHYDYDDMVALQHALLTQGLGVNHLRLVMGTSMGCMHSWVWTENYPDFMDASMPLACLPTEIAGRNRMWRKMLMDGIKADPAWNNGNYTQQPMEGLRLAEDLLIIAGSAPLFNQKQAPTRDAADALVEQRVSAALKTLDANDLIYQVESSFTYNPEPRLEAVKVPVMAVNSADDFINPPELGILEKLIKRVTKGRAVIIPISDATRGHGSHTIAALWGNYLQELLQQSGGLLPGTSWTAPQAPTSPAVGSAASPIPSGVYRVGDGVSAPRIISRPDPDYSEYARQRKISGTVVLSVIVGPDGLVQEAHVTRGLEPSLDRNAVEAIKKWRFQPAAKDGAPVSVQIFVESSFRLQ